MLVLDMMVDLSHMALVRGRRPALPPPATAASRAVGPRRDRLRTSQPGRGAYRARDLTDASWRGEEDIVRGRAQEPRRAHGRTGGMDRTLGESAAAAGLVRQTGRQPTRVRVRVRAMYWKGTPVARQTIQQPLCDCESNSRNTFAVRSPHCMLYEPPEPGRLVTGCLGRRRRPGLRAARARRTYRLLESKAQ